jgi:hypothetical protein
MVGEIMSGLKMEAEAGVLFEVCSKEDVANAVKESLRDKTEQIWEGNNFSTDASGNCNSFVYSVPVGKRLKIQRLVVWADGATNPHTPSTLGWWALLTEGPNFMVGNVAEYAPQPGQTTVLPFINDYGEFDAPTFQPGSDVWFFGSTLVVSTNISVNFQGVLIPVGKRHNRDVGPLPSLDDARQGRKAR